LAEDVTFPALAHRTISFTNSMLWEHGGFALHKSWGAAAVRSSGIKVTLEACLQAPVWSSQSLKPIEHRKTKTDWSPNIHQGSYQLRLASTEADRIAAFRLRFLVFNLELNEGLECAYVTGQDSDEFDGICDHLIVEHVGTGKIVGTYRLQTGAVASANAGFYSEREFDFSPYRQLGNSVIELGRACVHRDHRTSEVLYLLWRGIAQYAIHHGGRYLIGCSSLTSQDPAHGTAVYEAMREQLVEPHLRTTPQPAFAMPLMSADNASDKIPKLLRAYLAVGAKICGPPAIDREFRTIDFLTLLDLEALHRRVYARFMRI
jgi:putative hemolysin